MAIWKIQVSLLLVDMSSNFQHFNRMNKIVKFAIQKLLNLNLFLDVKTLQEQNARKIRDQVLATRLYLFLFFTIFVTFLLVNNLTTRVISVTILEPSINTYDRLYAAHPNTLSCPCKVVAVRYAEFMSMNYVQHPVSFSPQLRAFRDHVHVYMKFSLIGTSNKKQFHS